MADIRKPRKGSMAYRPRKRSKSQVPNVYWPYLEDKRLLGFAGYKAGMIQIAYIDDGNSPTKGKEVVTAATVVEVPPMRVYGIRAYKKGHAAGDLLTSDEKVLKLLKIKKSKKSKEIKPEECDEISVLIFSSPSKTTIGKKHIERMEIRVGGRDCAEKLEYAKGLLGKELKIGEIFKVGEYLDVISITRGKGWQGPIKRFGASLQRRKGTGVRRHIGCLGPFKPAIMMYTSPHGGQMGYHKRTELNKRVFKIGENSEEINPKSGFPHYGFVKNDYIILKGSVPGPTKRLIRMRIAVRGGEVREPVIKDIINDR